MTKTEANQLLIDLRAGKEERLAQLYKDYHALFIHWTAQYFSMERAEAEDIFQEIMVVFYRNVQLGKLTELKADIKTYLFAVGKHLIYNKRRKKRPTTTLEDMDLSHWDLTLYHQIEENHQQQMIAQALEKLGKACQKLIQLFFFKNFSSEAVATEMKYSTTDSARSRKLRCIKELRKIFSIK